MKDDKCFIVGKNLDEIARIKDKTKAGTGRSNDNWSAITKAIEKGEISLDTKVKISRKAAAEPPSKLGLRAGSSIQLRYLIRAAAVNPINIKAIRCLPR